MINFIFTKAEDRHCWTPIVWNRACAFRGSAPAKRAARERSSLCVAHRGTCNVGISDLCVEVSRDRRDSTAARSGLVFVSASHRLGALY